MFEPAIQFINQITPKDEIVIVFNNDGDGVCSCALLKKTLTKLGCKEPYIIAQPMPTEKQLIRKIQTSLPKKIIFLDLAMDQQFDVLKKLGKGFDMLVIDHHKIETDLNKHEIIHVNPRLEKPDVYQSTTYLTYKICSEITDLTNELWIAGVGMIADYDLSFSVDVVEQVQNKYQMTHVKNTTLTTIAHMIEAAHSTKVLTCEEIVHVFEQVTSFEEFFKTPKVEQMEKAHSIIQEEMEHIDSEFAARAEKIGNLLLFTPQSKYGLLSAVSTKYGSTYPDKTVIIYEKKGKVYKVSARNQSCVDVAKLLQKAAKGCKAAAGGHKAAAGATVSENDWKTFLQRVKKYAK